MQDNLPRQRLAQGSYWHLHPGLDSRKGQFGFPAIVKAHLANFLQLRNEVHYRPQEPLEPFQDRRVRYQSLTLQPCHRFGQHPTLSCQYIHASLSREECAQLTLLSPRTFTTQPKYPNTGRRGREATCVESRPRFQKLICLRLLRISSSGLSSVRPLFPRCLFARVWRPRLFINPLHLGGLVLTGCMRADTFQLE